MCAAIYKNFITDERSELQRLFHKPFKDCALYISKMDTIRKSEMAAQIEFMLQSLYEQTDRYGNSDYPADEQIGPDIFIMVMDKIKRWETILYWLYEIDILMGETKLDQMIKEAEERLEKNNWNKDLTRVRYHVGEDGKRHRVVVNALDELCELQYAYEDRGNHTEEIMDAAKELMLKYFK